MYSVCTNLYAGSERNKLSGATGEHFREACSINKSLTCLGRVIMELVEAQRLPQGRRHVHIPYRDSRLTFLLQVKPFLWFQISKTIHESRKCKNNTDCTIGHVRNMYTNTNPDFV